jgi:hypothetical protein
LLGAAGEYLGAKSKYMTNLNGLTWSETFQDSPHFYILSSDQRVYRTFATLNVTSNDPDPFNFDSAARADAENSARFTQEENCVVMYFGRGQGGNVVRTPVRAEVSPWATQSI